MDIPTLRRTLVLPRTHTSISCPILATRTWERRVDSTWDACISYDIAGGKDGGLELLSAKSFD